MKKIIFIRHGKQEYGKDGSLTDLGKQQAEKTATSIAEHYRETGVAGIYTSTLKRGKETGEVIREKFHAPPITSSYELREMVNWAGGSGDPDETMEEFKGLWKTMLNNRDYKYVGPDGRARNSAREAGQRLDNFLQELPDSEKPYIVVAHGGILAELLRNHFTNEEIDRYMPHFSGIGTDGWKGFGHCSISDLTLEGDHYSIEGLNSTRHLEGGLGEGVITSGYVEGGVSSTAEGISSDHKE